MTRDGRTYSGAPDYGWTVSLSLEDGGCGTGQISGRGGDYEFAAQLDGTGEVDFVVSLNDRTVDTDTKNYDCPDFDGEQSSRTIVKLEVIGVEAAELASILMADAARWLTGDLGDPSLARVPPKFHLPKAILGMDISLGQKHVIWIFRVNVRDTVFVPVNFDRPFKTSQRDGAIMVGKRLAYGRDEGYADDDDDDE